MADDDDKDYISSFADSSRFKNNPIFKAFKKTLQITFYHNYFQVANPLGNKTNKFKIPGFYFSLGNLRSENRSRLKDIHLVILCNASLLKKYSYQTILTPFLEDMKVLETS